MNLDLIGHQVAFFKAFIGKDSEIQTALNKLCMLSTREGQTLGAATFSVINRILGLLEKKIQG